LVAVALTTPRFSGDSHALLPLATDWDFEFHLEMEIRAENENGLLLYSGENLSASKDFLVLELLDSYVVYRLQMGRTTISIQSRYKVPLGDTVMIRAGRSIVDLYLRVASEDQIVTTVQVKTLFAFCPIN
jgi:Laminin G domain